MFQRFQLHFVRLRPLHGADRFPLQIAVHHKDHRLVVGKIADDCRDGFQPCKVCGVKPPVTGYHFISALRVGTDDGGVENPHLHDAVYRLLHQLIVQHLEWVVSEWVDLRHRYLLYLFPGFLFWHCYHLLEMTKAAGIAYGLDESLRHIVADETSVVVPDGQRGVIQGG